MITKKIKVNVIEEKIEPHFADKLKDVLITNETISIPILENKKIEYTIIPENSFIENIKWSSSNDDVASVNDGIINAKGVGMATITAVFNSKIIKNINVSVFVPVTDINVFTNPKLVMKIGDKETINTNIIPDNATHKDLKYDNSNPNAISIDDNGIITALDVGKGTITINTSNENVKKEIEYIVNPKRGIINGDGGIWGYTSLLDQIPERADYDFFKNLVNNGQGSLNGNIYSFIKDDKNYSYDLSKSLLTLNRKTVLTRIYYPKNVDLSTVNTFTFCNGTGNSAKGFTGFMREADNNRNYIKSSGIIIFVATQDGVTYNHDEIMVATEFVKDIVNQKNGVKNAIGGYSGSGAEVGYAAYKGLYNRLILFNSYFWPSKTPGLNDTEITIYTLKDDKLENLTQQTINGLRNNNYTNVTIVSNNTNFVSEYQNNFLVINPGIQMGTGHGYINMPITGLFSYACR